MNLRTTALATALVAASVPSLPASANAAHWGRGWGWGGVGLGLLAGAAITTALAAPYYSYYDPGYYASGAPFATYPPGYGYDYTYNNAPVYTYSYTPGYYAYAPGWGARRVYHIRHHYWH